ncbi:MAG TPA: transketolase C-terminal domain-containing protein [Thermoanaerobaculia bacterium]|jgi:transketolase|nr:transketolase C-terminal domain-containing protein [Thermoanaerobaculia bacterium]
MTVGGSPQWVAPDGLSAAAACRLAQRELARRDARFFSLEANPDDAGGLPFRAEFPERYVAWTGAEASLIGAAGGLALAGKIPLVNMFSARGLMRACEQVRLDLCYHHANAKLFGSIDEGPEAGSPEGAHRAIGDLALARSLPNLTVIAPADATAAYHATLAAGAHAGPVYVRLARHATPPVYGLGCRFEIGRGIVLRDGSDLTLVAASPAVVAAALAAAELLRRDGIDARVIDLHTVKPIDRALLAQAAEETGLIVTVEEHPVRGGLGGAVAEALGDDCPVPMRILGVPDACREQAGTRQEQLRRCGLDAPGIAGSARRALARWQGERA